MERLGRGGVDRGAEPRGVAAARARGRPARRRPPARRDARRGRSRRCPRRVSPLTTGSRTTPRIASATAAARACPTGSPSARGVSARCRTRSPTRHPTTTSRALLALAAKAGATVIPYGGGTSVVGGVTPAADDDRPTLTLALDQLAGLSDLDERSGLATFGAGTAGPDLEAALAPHGLTLGHFPQSFERSTLGGWVAARSVGQQSMGFGRIEALFAGGRLVAPAGTLDLPPHPASAAGPDLRQLVLGSEGRLGSSPGRPSGPSRSRHARPSPPGSCPTGRTPSTLARESRGPGCRCRCSAPRRRSRPQSLLAMARPVPRRRRPARATSGFAGSGRSRVSSSSGRAACERFVEGAVREAGSILAAATAASPSAARSGGAGSRPRFRLGGAARHALGRRLRGRHARDRGRLDAPAGPRRGGRPGAPPRARRRRRARPRVQPPVARLPERLEPVRDVRLPAIAADPDETLERWRRLKRGASEAIVAGGGTISHQHGVGRDHLPYLAAEKGELGMAALARRRPPLRPGRDHEPGRARGAGRVTAATGDHILAIDVGTQSVRALAYRPARRGRRVRAHLRSSRTSRRSPAGPSRTRSSTGGRSATRAGRCGPAGPSERTPSPR